jgi:hypothetical protein
MVIAFLGVHIDGNRLTVHVQGSARIAESGILVADEDPERDRLPRRAARQGTGRWIEKGNPERAIYIGSPEEIPRQSPAPFYTVRAAVR